MHGDTWRLAIQQRSSVMWVILHALLPPLSHASRGMKNSAAADYESCDNEWYLKKRRRRPQYSLLRKVHFSVQIFNTKLPHEIVDDKGTGCFPFLKAGEVFVMNIDQ